MKYYITETRRGWMTWEFEVEADNEEEALAKVMDGKVEATFYETVEDPHAESEYEFE